MTICPIALVVGCEKCPAFAFCPLTNLLGDQQVEGEIVSPGEVREENKQYVLARECNECEITPDMPPVLTYLIELGEDNEKKGVATFNSRKEASEYVEDVLGEDLEDIIIMPLEEADLDEEHDHGNNLNF
jgi:hypothetical protein